MSGLALLFVVFVFAFSGVLAELAGRWLSDPDAGYGMLVPLVSAYLVWRVWPRLRGEPLRPDGRALALVIAALLLAVAGVSAALPSLARLAIPLFLLGAVGYLAGPVWFRRLLFPLGFLLFMLPLPDQIRALLTPELQRMAVWLAEHGLRLGGYAASSRGNLILVEGHPLNVAEACSGLRYIFPLVGVGMLYAGLFETVWWKRMVNVLAAAPIAVLMNGLRIVGTGVMASRYGEQAATGWYHAAEGYLVLLCAFCLHFLFGRFLRFFPPPSTGRTEVAAPEPVVHPTPKRRLVVLMVLLLGFRGFAASLDAIPAWTPGSDWRQFPTALPGWRGRRLETPERIVAASGAERAYSALYQAPGGKTVHLYIGFQGRPAGAGSRFFHSPDVCLPASGWTTVSAGVGRLAGLEVSEQVSSLGGRRLLLVYWFQSNQGEDASAFAHRWRLALQALRRDRSYDLFIRVASEIGEEESVDAARRRIGHFVARLSPVLTDFLARESAPEPGLASAVEQIKRVRWGSLGGLVHEYSKDLE